MRLLIGTIKPKYEYDESIFKPVISHVPRALASSFFPVAHHREADFRKKFGVTSDVMKYAHEVRR